MSTRSKRQAEFVWPIGIEGAEWEHFAYPADERQRYTQLLERLSKQFYESLVVVSQDTQIKDLKHRLAHLESLVEGKVIKTGGEEAYERLRPSLDGLRGKFVAIDTEVEAVVGVGNTLVEAFEDAKKKTGKQQFYFRKVGAKAVIHV